MAIPPEYGDTYRQFWSLIQQAASTIAPDGGYAYTSPTVVSAAAQIARDTGLTFGPRTAPQIVSLFSIARANARAADSLTSAEPAARINTGMVGTWPIAASETIQATQPVYMAKASFTYTNNLGEVSTGWVTLTGMTQLPQTVANLRLRLQGAAQISYARPPQEGGSPKTEAEMMTEFGDFTSIQLYAV